LINIFPIGEERSEPSHTLVGHSQNVCTLNSTLSGVIISGSWDQLGVILLDPCWRTDATNPRTARVWKNFASEYELKGHTQAVWAAIAIDDDQFLTGELLISLIK
jgi:phospholipase A-2-activating protein